MGSQVNSSIPLVDLPISRVTSRGTNRASVSTQEYASWVDSHAKQPIHRTLYPGPIYQDLAIYLQRKPLPPREIRPNDPSHARVRSHATIYALDAKPSRAPSAFSSADACCKELIANNSQQVPQLVFLRGLSCPQWLNKVASTLNADPELLNSNMQFRCRETYAAYPSPPSTYDFIIRMRIVTIGRRDDVPWGRPNPQVVEKLRAEAKGKMDRYRHELSNVNMRCGDSIVRDYHVLGERHFFIEQEISVSILPGESAWIALICSDFGNSLTEGPRGPWLSDSDLQPGRVNTTTFFPTIQHRKRVAFRSKLVDESALEGANPEFAQTASLLALDYGRLLDKSAMAADAFYALNDLYRFAIASDNQLLNLIEHYVLLDTGHESLLNDKPSLSNLVYYRELLESYSGHLNENIEVLRRRGGLQWPRISEQSRSSHSKVEVAAEALLRDSEYLKHRAHSICKRCERGMGVIMNNRMLAESKRAISQASAVARLTFIAFVYIPLSFTTSFFGMNFSELGSGHRPIWIWIATSVPVLCTTVILFFLDFQRVRKLWWSAWSWVGASGRTKPSDDEMV